MDQKIVKYWNFGAKNGQNSNSELDFLDPLFSALSGLLILE